MLLEKLTDICLVDHGVHEHRCGCLYRQFLQAPGQEDSAECDAWSSIKVLLPAQKGRG